MKRIILLGAALVLTSGAAFGQFSIAGAILGDSAKSTPGFSYPVTSVQGYGGSHAAYTQGVHALFVNPAELAFNKESEFNLFTFDFSLLNAVWVNNAIGAVSQGLSEGFNLEDPSSLSGITELFGDGGPFGMELRGPFNVAYAGKGWGVGLWQRIWTDDTEVDGLDFRANLYLDIIINGGMAFTVYENDFLKTSVGFTAKIFGRAGVSLNMGFLDILHATADVSNSGDAATALTSTVDAPVILGGGVDVGASVHMNLLGDLVAAVTIQDLFTMGGSVGDLGQVVQGLMEGAVPVSGDGATLYTAPTLFNIGVAWKPDMSFVGNWITLAAFADYKDLAGAFMTPTLTSRHPILNLSFGVEAGFLGLVYVRAGMSQMLPSIGIGVDLFICKIDLAVYGRELGKNPGEKPMTAVDASLRFAL